VTADSLATLCDREALFDIIRRTAALLDNEALDDWLALFAAESL
jgi:3-phenylpropionate/cinnamic acid dioxygenase small subunit